MKTRLIAAMLFATTCAAPLQAQDSYGVMVMAHGGGDEWNAGVLETVEPLRGEYPLEVAFGMADAVSIQEAARKLEAQGVTHIGVVKLFISGESWHERTQQILGITEGAPERPAPDEHAHGQEHAAHGAGHSMEFWRLDSAATFALSEEGLAEAAESGEVLRDRIAALSSTPASEDILILAHGPEDDAENARWLAWMEEHVQPLREDYHAIRVATLREDWPEKREAAERELRAFVHAANDAGRRAIVIPFRVFGFGPYAELLGGLDYVTDEQGLIPHPAIGRWILRQAEALR